MTTTFARPKWYTDQHDSAWEKVKDAFRRDWQQTKHDMGAKVPDLNQQVGDTVAQAAGSKPIPPANVPTPHPAPAKSGEYSVADEPAYRYGYAASQQYGQNDWDDQTETLLRSDWADDAEWERSREAVRCGWTYGKLQRKPR